jgi:L-ribulose-5-phosphate 4-epimerase
MSRAGRSFTELKRRAFEANLELPRRGLVIYTFGNVSVADRSRGVFAIKPSGVEYQALRPSDISVVDMNGRPVEGKLRPSSDTKTHAVLYRCFEKIGSVAHTHSTYATAWAQAMKTIPVLGTTHADHLAADIPCTRVMSETAIAGEYEEETGRQIVEAFRGLSYEEVEMVLVACHGPFTWGGTPEKAVYNSVILEELAKMAALTLGINPSAPRLKKSLLDRHYRRKHGKDAYYGQK